MALSLSGDDEEYDSESEQVRAPTFSLCDVFVLVCVVLLSKCAVGKKVFCERNGVFLQLASG